MNNGLALNIPTPQEAQQKLNMLHYRDNREIHFWPAYSSLISYLQSEAVVRNLQPHLLQFVFEVVDKHHVKKQKIDFEKEIISCDPDNIFTSFERQKAIFLILTQNEGTKPLGFRTRLKLWLRATNVRNMIDRMPGYVNELTNMEFFPNLNFAQIEVDIPRM